MNVLRENLLPIYCKLVIGLDDLLFQWKQKIMKERIKNLSIGTLNGWKKKEDLHIKLIAIVN